MLIKLIDFSLNNRFLIIVLMSLVAVMGVFSALQIPIDAVPDMTNTQVQILTDAGTLSPLEVEQLVSYPLEATMSGLPDVEEIRSISKLGLSVVTVVFRERTDLQLARNWVSERLPNAKAKIGIYGDPQIGTPTTALGEILQFEVKGTTQTPMELRSILEWQIAPRLRETRGVTDVNSHGGYYRTYEVQVDPERLASYGLGMNEVISAIENNNQNTGGGYIVHFGEQRFVRGQAFLQSMSDIEQVVVKSRPNGLPILVRDVGQVVLEPFPRQGLVTRDGRGEIVTGMAMMLRGENSRTVVEAVKEKLAEISVSLPAGVTVEVIYDRAHLINRTLNTVLKNLLEGGILVVVVLFVMLGNFRAGIIVAMAIPLSMLFATNIMMYAAISASLMSLGAIDFGLIVDSSVIMIENCIRRLAERSQELPAGTFLTPRERMSIIRNAAIEVRKPTMFGELIIAVVYLPILFLEGTEGKLFRPMALTVLFALAGSLVLSLTLMPVLAFLGLPKRVEEKDVWLIRLIKFIYRPVVALAVRVPVMTLAVAFLLVAISVPMAQRLGAEFMPRLDEGDLLIEAGRLPSASLEDAVPRSTEIENIVKAFPQVKTVFSKTGRPEIANDVMGVHQTDVWVILKPRSTWPDPELTRDQLIEQLAEKLQNSVPGVIFGYTQPIEMRVDELVAGVKADVAVLLYGDDLKVLSSKAKELERVLKGIEGAVDVKADIQSNIPSIVITPKREELARYGLSVADVMLAIETVGGRSVGQIHDGRARYPIVVRLPKKWRENIEFLKRVPVQQRNDYPITLGSVAKIELEESPPGIEHDSGRRRTFVAANVRNRDVASFVQEAQETIKREVKLDAGYSIEWGGDFENLQSASLRLAIITPFVLLLIWMLLFSTFNSVRLAMLIFLAVPIAASGGIVALWMRSMPFSISAGVGFIALFGVAVLNGLVWVSGAENARRSGLAAKDAALLTAETRLRPVLMTALVASLGFAPMALSSSAGAEIQRPLASVVIGGLVTSTLLTAIVIPAIYPWFAPKKIDEERDESIAVG